mgnify:CR=1 FL=1
MSDAWGKYQDPVRIDGEVIGANWIHNVDSQPDYTPSAPPEEMVTGLYPSLEGLEDELNRDDAPEIQETSEMPSVNGDGEIIEEEKG